MRIEGLVKRNSTDVQNLNIFGGETSKIIPTLITHTRCTSQYSCRSTINRERLLQVERNLLSLNRRRLPKKKRDIFFRQRPTAPRIDFGGIEASTQKQEKFDTGLKPWHLALLKTECTHNLNIYKPSMWAPDIRKLLNSKCHWSHPQFSLSAYEESILISDCVLSFIVNGQRTNIVIPFRHILDTTPCLNTSRLLRASQLGVWNWTW